MSTTIAKNNNGNRIASDIEQWQQVQQGLYERHGKRVGYDNQFLRAKRDHYKSIENKYKKSRLNPHEKAELRIMRSERKAIMRRLYPNPYVRLLRNLAVLAFNVVKSATKILIQGAKSLYNDSPGKLMDEPKPLIKNDRPIIHGPGAKLIVHSNKNASKRAIKPKATAPVIRKNSARSRVQMAGNARGRKI